MYHNVLFCTALSTISELDPSADIPSSPCCHKHSSGPFDLDLKGKAAQDAQDEQDNLLACAVEDGTQLEKVIYSCYVCYMTSYRV